MNKRSRFILIMVITVIGVLGLYLYWTHYQKHLAESTLNASGTIETDEIEVGSHVGGRIADVKTPEGSKVNLGQVLVAIEPYQIPEQRAQLQAQMQQAQAQLQAMINGARPQEVQAARATYNAALAQANLVQAGPRTEDIQQAQAGRTQAQANLDEAQTQYQRMLTLRQRQVISEQELDTTRTRYQVAQQQLEAANQRLLALQHGSRPQEIQAARQQAAAQGAQLNLVEAGTRQENIEAQRAAIEAIQAQIQQLNQAYKELFVQSPCNCEVSTLSVNKGQIVRPDQTIATLVDMGDLWVRVYIPEERFGQVQPGDKAMLKVDAYPGQIFSGRVIQVATQAEFTPRNVQTEETRKILVFGVKVAIDNSKRLLRPGMPADVSFAIQPHRQEATHGP